MKKIFNEAITFAVEKHKNQKRKGSDMPYIVHIYDVVQTLQENGAEFDTIIAGILHDTVEDTNTTLDEIESKFGINIRNMVDVLSENKSLPYVERKKLQAERIKNASIQVKMIKCADCLSNLRSIHNDLTISPDIWSKFNASKEKIQNHYADFIKAMSELKELEMYKQLKYFYIKVFNQILSKSNDPYEKQSSPKDCPVINM